MDKLSYSKTANKAYVSDFESSIEIAFKNLL